MFIHSCGITVREKQRENALRPTCALSNISNPTMRTGLDFKFTQFDQARGEALKSSPVRIEGFEMTSHTDKSLLNKMS
jgi:hypothetical protein